MGAATTKKRSLAAGAAILKLREDPLSSEAIAALVPGVAKTLDEVAEFFGMSPNTIKQSWKSAGMPGRSGRYPLAQIAEWRLKHLASVEDGKRGPSDQAKQLKQRLAEAEVRKVELDVERKEREQQKAIGNLIDRQAVLSVQSALNAGLAARFAERTVANKIYKILENIRQTAGQLPPPRFRKLTEIRLSSSPWYVAWSGSDTMLADLSAFYGYANEIDKWSMAEKLAGDAGDGDALDQFFERFKEFYNYKVLLECSPTTKRKSRIENRRLMGNNCRYNVPCPKCGTHQALRLGKEGEPGGLRWDRAPDGSSDPSIARKTARYVCCHCEFEALNHHRPLMMRRGVWCPEGCSVDKRGRVRGTPRRGPRIWSSQLSSLYSLQMGWGEIAEKFLQSKGTAKGMRTFANGWLAETWEPFKAKSEPEEVGQRLTVAGAKRGVIPAWATYLFAAVDRQLDHFVYWVVACDAEEREHLVDHGTLDNLEEVERVVIRREFDHEDGEGPLCPAVTAIDCGYQTKEVYEFCQRFKKTKHRVVPIKGANTDCAGEPYEKKIIGVNEGKTTRTRRRLIRAGRGLPRVRVNPFYYEPITQQQLEKGQPGKPGALTFHEECIDDTDLLRQLCNGAESPEPSKSDPDRHLWVKRWDGDANDYRDCKKYARCVMDVHFRRIWQRAQVRQGAREKVAELPPFAEQDAADGQRPRPPRRRQEVREQRRPRSRRPT